MILERVTVGCPFLFLADEESVADNWYLPDGCFCQSRKGV